MPTPEYGLPLRIFWKVHRWIFRISRGRIGGRFAGNKVLMLTTVGRKSGLPRQNTLYYFEDQGRYIVIGSNVGRDRHPYWYHNLQAQPQSTILVDQTNLQVIALEAAGDERERLWQLVVTMDPDYDQHKARTTRTIPVVILSPDQGG